MGKIGVIRALQGAAEGWKGWRKYELVVDMDLVRRVPKVRGMLEVVAFQVRYLEVGSDSRLRYRGSNYHVTYPGGYQSPNPSSSRSTTIGRPVCPRNPKRPGEPCCLTLTARSSPSLSCASVALSPSRFLPRLASVVLQYEAQPFTTGYLGTCYSPQDRRSRSIIGSPSPNAALTGTVRSTQPSLLPS
jgi:hypothetical protein